MRILLAGATGAIGRPLTSAFLAAGHEVHGTTRSAAKAAEITAAGASGIVLDAHDRDLVRRVVGEVRPDLLIHQLTALPQGSSARAFRRGLAETARLRRETVPVFLEAAAEAGTPRAIIQSISFITEPDGRPIHDESAPTWTSCGAETRTTIAAVEAMEAAAATSPVEALVLRYGFYYGPGTAWSSGGAMGALLRRRMLPVIGSGEGRMSFVHIDDAVSATVAAVARGERGVYNVCDDEPARAADWTPEAARLMGARPPLRIPARLARLAVPEALVHYNTTLPGNSNAKAKAALSWQPRPWRQGFQQAYRPAR